MMHSCQLQRNSEALRLGIFSRSSAAHGNVRLKSSLVQVGIEHTHGQPHKYISLEASPTEIQTPKEWNMISGSLTSPLSVLLPSSIPLQPSHCTESRRVSIFFIFLLFKKIVRLKLRNLKLRKSGCACSAIRLFFLYGHWRRTTYLGNVVAIPVQCLQTAKLPALTRTSTQNVVLS